MDYEVFVGANGKKYYVYGEGRSFNDVSRDLAKKTHRSAEDFYCYTCWVTRGEEEDCMYFQPVKGSKRMLVAVKGSVI